MPDLKVHTKMLTGNSRAYIGHQSARNTREATEDQA